MKLWVKNVLKVDSQKSEIFFPNIGIISASILCEIHRSFRICNYFLAKTNISGLINAFVTL